MKTKSLSVPALIIILILNACSPFTIVSSSGEQPTPQVEEIPAVESQPELQPVQVEHVEVQVGVGSPLPVEIVVSGLWPQLCSQIAEIQSNVDGFQIDVTILASSVEGCPPDHVGLSFRFALPLNIVEMPEGAYTVTVNGTSTTFEWPVKTEALPGSISGWVWHDECISGPDGQPAPTSTPPGCVEDESALGAYHANGLLEPHELPIEGIRVTLREGDCTNTSLVGIKDEVITTATGLSYTFTDVTAGTYCISVNAQEEPNFSLLAPGIWSSPNATQGIMAQTVTLAAGENKGDVNFGWDHQFQ